MELFRYIGLEDFINLAINNKEKFVRPSSWDDKYEAYLFSYMETPEDVRRIVSEMYYNFCRENYYAIPDNYFEMWRSKWFSYAQCWSKHPETDAMWRCYSYGNRAIRIRTTYDNLLTHAKKVFPEEKQFKVYLKEVVYDLNKKSALRQQFIQMQKSLLPHETYFHKRPAFEHEGEYRLLIVDKNSSGVDNLSSLGVKFKIGEKVRSKSDEEIIDYLTEKICVRRVDWNITDKDNVRIENAGDISEFLKGVMVHPLAPEWYVNIIKDICELKKIEFDGQSDIYTLK